MLSPRDTTTFVEVKGPNAQLLLLEDHSNLSGLYWVKEGVVAIFESEVEKSSVG